MNAAFSYYAEKNAAKIHVVRYRPDKNSPFKLQSSSRIILYNRDEMEFNKLKDIIEMNSIKVVICSGWGDKLYMKLSKWAHDHGRLTICIADNQWMGTFKQKLLVLLSPFILKNRFSKMWIPGMYQFEYARRLGFARYDIMMRYYTADTNLFVAKKDIVVPKRFVYVGRLLEIKGVDILLNGLKLLIPELNKHSWKFMVIGSGDHQDEFKRLSDDNNCIEYYPFLQPQELAAKTAEGGVFVLPSNYDAWGVVVHEYSILGSPLLMSEAVGSRSAFLIEGYNGKVFITGSPESLFSQAVSFMDSSQDDLNKMGKRSQDLAAGYNLESWSCVLSNAINDFTRGIKHKKLKRTKYQ